MRLLYITIFFLIMVSFANATIVDKVEFTGNKRVPLSRIDHHLIGVGKDFDPEVLNRSIQNLYETGFFAEIAVDATVQGDKFVLTYIVRETPKIEKITVNGNKKITGEKMQNLIEFKIGDTLSPIRIGYTIKNITNAYEKESYYNVVVTHRVEYMNELSVNLVFDVVEGDKSKVYNIWFLGNEAFPDIELRQKMMTKERDFWSVMNGSGNVLKDVTEGDREALREFYFSQGYINVEIGEPEIVFQETNVSRMNYTLRIKEGDQYSVKSILYSDPTGTLTAEEMKKDQQLKEGDIFNIQLLRKDRESLVSKYTEIGYAKAYIDDKIAPNDEDKTVALEYTVVPGKIYTIGKIEVRGNIKSYDNVVRREVDLIEGQRYNSKLIKEAVANMRATGFFLSVDVSEKDSGVDEIDLIFNVVDNDKTGTLGLQLSYSTYDDFGVMFKISRENLFGLGYSASASAEFNSKKTDYRLRFRNPWLFDKPVSFSFDIFSTTREYDNYDKEGKGIEVSLGSQLIKRRVYLDLYMSHEEADIYGISDNASKYIKRQKGIHVTNSITPVLTYENLDNRLDPRSGLKTSIQLESAGQFLGGNSDYLRLYLDGTYHQPIVNSFVGSLHAEAGHLWKTGGDYLPIDKRYTKGGMNSIRGFKYGDLDPVDSDGENFGGDKYYQFNAELWRPLVDGNVSIRGVLFFDMAQVYKEGEKFFSSAPRKSIGAGLRFFTPVGLLRLEYGYKLDKKPGESSGVLDFSIGAVF